jgi:hypothetical protein
VLTDERRLDVLSGTIAANGVRVRIKKSEAAQAPHSSESQVDPELRFDPLELTQTEATAQAHHARTCNGL